MAPPVGATGSQSQSQPQQQRQQQQQFVDAAQFYGLYKTAKTLARSYQVVAHQKDDQVKALTKEMEELKQRLQMMEAQHQLQHQQGLRPGAQPVHPPPPNSRGANVPITSMAAFASAPNSSRSQPVGPASVRRSVAQAPQQQSAAARTAAAAAAGASTKPEHPSGQVPAAVQAPVSARTGAVHASMDMQQQAVFARHMMRYGNAPQAQAQALLQQQQQQQQQLLHARQQQQQQLPHQPQPTQQDSASSVASRVVLSARAHGDVWFAGTSHSRSQSQCPSHISQSQKPGQAQGPGGGEADEAEDADNADASGKGKTAKGKFVKAFKKLLKVQAWRAGRDDDNSRQDNGGATAAVAPDATGRTSARQPLPPHHPQAQTGKLENARPLPPQQAAQATANAGAATAAPSHHRHQLWGSAIPESAAPHGSRAAAPPHGTATAQAAGVGVSDSLRSSQASGYGMGLLGLFDAPPLPSSDGYLGLTAPPLPVAPSALQRPSTVSPAGISRPVTLPTQYLLGSGSQQLSPTTATVASAVVVTSTTAPPPHQQQQHVAPASHPFEVPSSLYPSVPPPPLPLQRQPQPHKNSTQQQELQQQTQPQQAQAASSGNINNSGSVQAVAAAVQGSDLAYGRHGSSGVDLFAPTALTSLRRQQQQQNKQTDQQQPPQSSEPQQPTPQHVSASSPVSSARDLAAATVSEALLSPASAAGPGLAAAAAASPVATGGSNASATARSPSAATQSPGSGGKQASEGGNVWTMLVQRSGLGQVAQRLTSSAPGSRRSTDSSGTGTGSAGGANGGASQSANQATQQQQAATGGNPASAPLSRQSWGSEAPSEQRLHLSASNSSLTFRAAALQLGQLPPRPAGRAGTPAGGSAAAAGTAATAAPTTPASAGPVTAPYNAPSASDGASVGASADFVSPLSAPAAVHYHHPSPPVVSTTTAQEPPLAPVPQVVPQPPAVRAPQPQPTQMDVFAASPLSPAPTTAVTPSAATTADASAAAASEAYLNGILSRLKTPGVLRHTSAGGVLAASNANVTASWPAPAECMEEEPEAEGTNGRTHATGGAVGTVGRASIAVDSSMFRRDFGRSVGVAWRRKSLGYQNAAPTAAFHELQRTSAGNLGRPAAEGLADTQEPTTPTELTKPGSHGGPSASTCADPAHTTSPSRPAAPAAATPPSPSASSPRPTLAHAAAVWATRSPRGTGLASPRGMMMSSPRSAAPASSPVDHKIISKGAASPTPALGAVKAANIDVHYTVAPVRTSSPVSATANAKAPAVNATRSLVGKSQKPKSQNASPSLRLAVLANAPIAADADAPASVLTPGSGNRAQPGSARYADANAGGSSSSGGGGSPGPESDWLAGGDADSTAFDALTAGGNSTVVIHAVMQTGGATTAGTVTNNRGGHVTTATTAAATGVAAATGKFAPLPIAGGVDTASNRHEAMTTTPKAAGRPFSSAGPTPSSCSSVGSWDPEHDTEHRSSSAQRRHHFHHHLHLHVHHRPSDSAPRALWSSADGALQQQAKGGAAAIKGAPSAGSESITVAAAAAAGRTQPGVDAASATATPVTLHKRPGVTPPAKLRPFESSGGRMLSGGLATAAAAAEGSHNARGQPKLTVGSAPAAAVGAGSGRDVKVKSTSFPAAAVPAGDEYGAVAAGGAESPSVSSGAASSDFASAVTAAPSPSRSQQQQQCHQEQQSAPTPTAPAAPAACVPRADLQSPRTAATAAWERVQHTAATSIQAAWRGARARASVRGAAAEAADEEARRMAAEDRQRRETAAATTIQATWRGFRARTLAAELRAKRAAADERRRYLSAAMEQRRRRVVAAVIIQSVWRGFAVRKHVEAERLRALQTAALEGAAAVRLQAAWRGHKARVQAAAMRREAMEVQRRERAAAQRERQRQQAATDIQRVWRGHRCRVAFQEEQRLLQERERRELADLLAAELHQHLLMQQQQQQQAQQQQAQQQQYVSQQQQPHPVQYQQQRTTTAPSPPQTEYNADEASLLEAVEDAPLLLLRPLSAQQPVGLRLPLLTRSPRVTLAGADGSTTARLLTPREPAAPTVATGTPRYCQDEAADCAPLVLPPLPRRSSAGSDCGGGGRRSSGGGGGLLGGGGLIGGGSVSDGGAIGGPGHPVVPRLRLPSQGSSAAALVDANRPLSEGSAGGGGSNRNAPPPVYRSLVAAPPPPQLQLHPLPPPHQQQQPKSAPCSSRDYHAGSSGGGAVDPKAPYSHRGGFVSEEALAASLAFVSAAAATAHAAPPPPPQRAAPSVSAATSEGAATAGVEESVGENASEYEGASVSQGPETQEGCTTTRDSRGSGTYNISAVGGGKEEPEEEVGSQERGGKGGEAKEEGGEDVEEDVRGHYHQSSGRSSRCSSKCMRVDVLSSDGVSDSRVELEVSADGAEEPSRGQLSSGNNSSCNSNNITGGAGSHALSRSCALTEDEEVRSNVSNLSGGSASVSVSNNRKEHSRDAANSVSRSGRSVRSGRSNRSTRSSNLSSCSLNSDSESTQALLDTLVHLAAAAVERRLAPEDPQLAQLSAVLEDPTSRGEWLRRRLGQRLAQVEVPWDELEEVEEGEEMEDEEDEEDGEEVEGSAVERSEGGAISEDVVSGAVRSQGRQQHSGGYTGEGSAAEEEEEEVGGGGRSTASLLNQEPSWSGGSASIGDPVGGGAAGCGRVGAGSKDIDGDGDGDVVGELTTTAAVRNHPRGLHVSSRRGTRSAGGAEEEELQSPSAGTNLLALLSTYGDGGGADEGELGEGGEVVEQANAVAASTVAVASAGAVAAGVGAAAIGAAAGRGVPVPCIALELASTDEEEEEDGEAEAEGRSAAAAAAAAAAAVASATGPASGAHMPSREGPTPAVMAHPRSPAVETPTAATAGPSTPTARVAGADGTPGGGAPNSVFSFGYRSWGAPAAAPATPAWPGAAAAAAAGGGCDAGVTEAVAGAEADVAGRVAGSGPCFGGPQQQHMASPAVTQLSFGGFGGFCAGAVAPARDSSTGSAETPTSRLAVPSHHPNQPLSGTPHPRGRDSFPGFALPGFTLGDSAAPQHQHQAQELMQTPTLHAHPHPSNAAAAAAVGPVATATATAAHSSGHQTLLRSASLDAGAAGRSYSAAPEQSVDSSAMYGSANAATSDSAYASAVAAGSSQRAGSLTERGGGGHPWRRHSGGIVATNAGGSGAAAAGGGGAATPQSRRRPQPAVSTDSTNNSNGPSAFQSYGSCTTTMQYAVGAVSSARGAGSSAGTAAAAMLATSGSGAVAAAAATDDTIKSEEEAVTVTDGGPADSYAFGSCANMGEQQPQGGSGGGERLRALARGGPRQQPQVTGSPSVNGGTAGRHDMEEDAESLPAGSRRAGGGTYSLDSFGRPMHASVSQQQQLGLTRSQLSGAISEASGAVMRTNGLFQDNPVFEEEAEEEDEEGEEEEEDVFDSYGEEEVQLSCSSGDEGEEEDEEEEGEEEEEGAAGVWNGRPASV